MNFEVRFNHRSLKPIFSSEVEIHIYRIVLEALSNVMKHSKASEVVVQLEEKENSLFLSITDNGIGFNWNPFGHVEEGLSGVGIVSMQERANFLKGQMSILSKPGSGTTIRVHVPLLP
jgi:signal transduction histidine kinase